MKMFVGNLSFGETENSLRSTFETFGAVAKATIEVDRNSGQSRGFGFVEMGLDEEAGKAIEGLNGKMRNGRVLTVSVVGPPRGGGQGDKKRWY